MSADREDGERSLPPLYVCTSVAVRSSRSVLLSHEFLTLSYFLGFPQPIHLTLMGGSSASMRPVLTFSGSSVKYQHITHIDYHVGPRYSLRRSYLRTVMKQGGCYCRSSHRVPSPIARCESHQSRLDSHKPLHRIGGRFCALPIRPLLTSRSHVATPS